MSLSSTKKKYYIKPSIKVEEVDYCISMQGASAPGDPPGMMKKPSTPTKQTSPFGGSKPNYK